MQAKRKLTALLLSLCMLLGMLPMTAFAAGVPAAPPNLQLALAETGLKARLARNRGCKKRGAAGWPWVR